MGNEVLGSCKDSVLGLGKGPSVYGAPIFLGLLLTDPPPYKVGIVPRHHESTQYFWSQRVLLSLQQIDESIKCTSSLTPALQRSAICLTNGAILYLHFSVVAQVCKDWDHSRLIPTSLRYSEKNRSLFLLK
jgi:hypothetical protein